MSIKGTISFDRQSLMTGMTDPDKGFDRSNFSKLMGNTNSLTLEEYEKYAGSDSVSDFYYSYTVSFNGTESFEPVSSEEIHRC